MTDNNTAARLVVTHYESILFKLAEREDFLEKYMELLQLVNLYGEQEGLRLFREAYNLGE